MDVLERLKTGRSILNISKNDGNEFTWDMDGHKELVNLAKLGKLALQSELCHYEYQYADGDCQEGKCVRNELCKMKGSK